MSELVGSTNARVGQTPLVAAAIGLGRKHPRPRWAGRRGKREKATVLEAPTPACGRPTGEHHLVARGGSTHDRVGQAGTSQIRCTEGWKHPRPRALTGWLEAPTPAWGRHSQD